MNNPLVYTDPSGELVWFVPIIIGAVIYGSGNLAIHASRGEVNSFGDGLKYFATGAVAGAFVGATWSLGLASIGTGSLINGMGFMTSTAGKIVGTTILAGKGVNALTTGLSMISNPNNAGKILLGKTYFDNSGVHGFTQAFTRYSWEGLNTWAGYNYTQMRNIAKKVDQVEYFGGATFAIDEDVRYYNGWRGVSLGNYINAKVPKKVDYSHPMGWMYSANGLYWHEYGHTFDSQRFGITYLLAIGIPSASGATWTEKRANNNSWNYARRHGYMTKWLYPTRFPL